MTVYFGTSDIDASIAMIKDARRLAPTTPQDIPNVGRYATLHRHRGQRIRAVRGNQA